MIDNNVLEWANKWGVPREALTELFDYECQSSSGTPRDESYIQQLCELTASRNGSRLWRNNVGACQSTEGGFIRYGLANKSKQQNAHIKSSDLIGITPVVVTKEMVGTTVGVFTAIECKKTSWKYTGKGREVAQKRFIDLVKSLGGIAKFENGSGL